MKYFVLLFLFAAFAAAKEFDHGDCDNEWYLVEISYCQIQFFIRMNSSSNALESCPTHYSEAHACFEKRIVDECFPVNTTNEEDIKKIKALRKDFGDEEFFCKYGFLSTMKMIMEETTLKYCDNKTNNNYTTCEAPFREAFREEFSSTEKDFERLSKSYRESRSCQFNLATSCRIPLRTDTEFFYENQFLNPYNEETIKTVTKAADKIEHGDHLNDQTTTYVAVTIVGILIVIGIIITVIFFWRRDRDRAEIRKQKAEAKKQQQKNDTQENEDVELAPLSDEATKQESQASSA